MPSSVDVQETFPVAHAVETAREFILTRLADSDDKNNQRATSLRELFLSEMFTRLEARFDNRVSALKELHKTEIDALELRGQQRFEASEKALASAFAASKEAVSVAMSTAQSAVVSAMNASDKAIMKAEAAQHQHNLTQNEWRATVTELTKTTADQLRKEFITANVALADRLDISTKAMDARINAASSRLDTWEGRDRGQQMQHRSQVSNQTTSMVMIGTIVAVLTFGLNYFASRLSMLPGPAPQPIYLPMPQASIPQAFTPTAPR